MPLVFDGILSRFGALIKCIYLHLTTYLFDLLFNLDQKNDHRSPSPNKGPLHKKTTQHLQQKPCPIMCSSSDSEVLWTLIWFLRSTLSFSILFLVISLLSNSHVNIFFFDLAHVGSLILSNSRILLLLPYSLTTFNFL